MDEESEIMTIIETLLEKNVDNIPLNILVFGPNPEGQFDEQRINDLKKKRLEIAEYLRAKGHNVIFPENMIAPNSPPIDKADIPLMEMALMKEYDLIVNLVDTPGTNAEATMIMMKPDFARKSTMFICDEHRGGLVYGVCKLANTMGADLTEYKYPSDLVECHLLTKIAEKVRAIQIAAFLSN